MPKTLVTYGNVKAEVAGEEHKRRLRFSPVGGWVVEDLDTAACWDCDELIGRRSRAVTATTELQNPSGLTIVWHRRCFAGWRKSQGYKRGRGPKPVEVRHG